MWRFRSTAVICGTDETDIGNRGCFVACEVAAVVALSTPARRFGDLCSGPRRFIHRKRKECPPLFSCWARAWRTYTLRHHHPEIPILLPVCYPSALHAGITHGRLRMQSVHRTRLGPLCHTIGHHARPRRSSSTAPLRIGADQLQKHAEFAQGVHASASHSMCSVGGCRGVSGGEAASDGSATWGAPHMNNE